MHTMKFDMSVVFRDTTAPAASLGTTQEALGHRYVIDKAEFGMMRSCRR